MLNFSQTIFFENESTLSNYLKWFRVSKIIHKWFRESWTSPPSPKSNKSGNEILKVPSREVTQNNPTDLLGHSFFEVYNITPPRPPYPKSDFLLPFSRFVMAHRVFFGCGPSGPPGHPTQRLPRFAFVHPPFLAPFPLARSTKTQFWNQMGSCWFTKGACWRFTKIDQSCKRNMISEMWWSQMFPKCVSMHLFPFCFEYLCTPNYEQYS